MRLGETDAPSELDLEGAVGAVLERRLRRGGARPVAVALSGGGDSLALLLAAAAWAKTAARPIHVLTVDHRLRPESRGWTEACAATAARLGLAFSALAWTGDKPLTGLPAAAREARHRLLADAARAAGARVILMGHTADDVLEARLMREAGSSTPEPREWSPSPAWPEGRGTFLLRPMLEVRRAEIRAWLSRRGQRWIDDPANEDPAFARPRARQALSQGAAPPAQPPAASPKSLALACALMDDGGLELPRAALAAADPRARLAFVSIACVCAAGARRPPRGEAVERLAARLASEAPFTAGLAGARVEGHGRMARFRRERGEAARGGLAPLWLTAGAPAVWDGRFEVDADRAVEVRARPGTALPMAVDEGRLTVRPLALERLLAACGAVEREPG